MEKFKNEKPQNISKIPEKTTKKPQNKKNINNNMKYFDFYDDVKASCQKVIDW